MFEPIVGSIDNEIWTRTKVGRVLGKVGTNRIDFDLGQDVEKWGMGLGELGEVAEGCGGVSWDCGVVFNGNETK